MYKSRFVLYITCVNLLSNVLILFVTELCRMMSSCFPDDLLVLEHMTICIFKVCTFSLEKVVRPKPNQSDHCYGHVDYTA